MKDPNHFLCLLLWALLLLVWVAFVRGRDMLLSPEGAPLISVSPESVLITQVQVGGKDMSSICRLLCMLIAASTIALATSAIISAATASPNSPTGELGTDAVYHAHEGLCKSKHRLKQQHLTLGLGKVRATHTSGSVNTTLWTVFGQHTLHSNHMRPPGSASGAWQAISSCANGPAGGPRRTSIDDRSVCQTICDWNTSCAAYEWGAGCYLSSEWGFEAINLRFTEGGRAGADALVRYPLAPSLPPRAISAVCSFLGPMALHLPAPAHTPYHNPNHETVYS